MTFYFKYECVRMKQETTEWCRNVKQNVWLELIDLSVCFLFSLKSFHNTWGFSRVCFFFSLSLCSSQYFQKAARRHKAFLLDTLWVFFKRSHTVFSFKPLVYEVCDLKCIFSLREIYIWENCRMNEADIKFWIHTGGHWFLEKDWRK